MRFLYLHGFASSPQSRKAQAFLAALPQLEIPALDEGDFEHLTITAQLAHLALTLKGQPASLIGSSMGGYLAALCAAAHPQIARLVLLAPAFGFMPRWKAQMADRKPEPLEVFHHGTQSMRRVHYGLIEDAVQYPPIPHFTQPALIFHGIHDEVVPVEFSRDFVAAHPNARLLELDSSHELLNVLHTIVSVSIPFLTQP
jgi:pimeloyl-ACP methyl ester carboxylesterase